MEIFLMDKLYDNEMVSVIIPVYNAEKYIDQTIKSVLDQTYKNIEIILVDDCSTDKSREIIKKYVDKYKNIICFFQKSNFGAAVARNKALDLARGRYIAFLDSDDLWYPHKIEEQLCLMKIKGIGFCYTSYEMINGRGQLIKGKIDILKEVSYKHLLKRTLISTPTVLLDRRLIGNVEIPLRRTGQDYAFWLLLLRNGRTAYGIDKALVKVRRRKNSLSANKLQNIRDVWEIQLRNEKLPLLFVFFNTICYIFNALKKRFLK